MVENSRGEQEHWSPVLNTELLSAFMESKRENESWVPDFDIWDYLSLSANADLAAAFFKLFWPDFVETDGCIILRHNYSAEGFARWLEHFEGNKTQVEAMVNHVHILDLFPMSPKDDEHKEELHEFLARALTLSWKAALREAFPEKHFVFTLRHGYGPEVSFHQGEPE
jgi:hypothetical protein